jgi:CRP/FNR family transcriptional regulator
LYPGDFFGSYKNGKYNYSADSIGDVRTCVFEQKKLDDYLERNVTLAKELLNQTSHELTLAQDRMSVLGKLDAIERLSKFILNISLQRKRIGWQNNPISIPMSRQDIADYLGLTIETVSREISKLKSTNIIKVISSKQIFINDMAKLTNLSS